MTANGSSTGIAEVVRALCLSEPLLHSTARAASLHSAGTGAATVVISARVAALTQGAVRALFLARLKTVSCALALTVLVGLGGVALVPGRGPLPTVGAAPTPHNVGDAKPIPEAQKLLQQLASPSFAERQAAQKALTNMGARAAASVQAGMEDPDAEVAKRCAALWPRLWKTEIARPDADRLAGCTHPLWARFRKVAGDDPDSRTLFAEMAADFKRFRRLEAVEAEPEKAAHAYAAELKLRVEALKRGYQEAEEAAGGRLGMLWPASGIPTRGELAALLFLGTYPSTAAVTYPEAGDDDRVSHHNVFALGLRPDARAKADVIPPAVRRLFVAWLGTRTDPNPLHFGMNLALYSHIAEVVPLARQKAADAALAAPARGFALLAVGRFGTAADLPLLEKAFADSRVFHKTKYTSETGQQRPEEVRVSDTAVAAALRLAGQQPADFGFPLLEMYKERGPDTLAKYHLLGFFDDETRQAAHKRARELLEKHGKEQPRTNTKK